MDSREEYEKIAEFMYAFMPGVNSTLELYEEREPVFDHFDVEPDIKKILNRRVRLKSGGYIVIVVKFSES